MPSIYVNMNSLVEQFFFFKCNRITALSIDCCTLLHDWTKGRAVWLQSSLLTSAGHQKVCQHLRLRELPSCEG